MTDQKTKILIPACLQSAGAARDEFLIRWGATPDVRMAASPWIPNLRAPAPDTVVPRLDMRMGVGSDLQSALQNEPPLPSIDIPPAPDRGPGVYRMEPARAAGASATLKKTFSYLVGALTAYSEKTFGPDAGSGTRFQG
jgi:hypothetical protein